jgi:hypothetical protein
LLVVALSTLALAAPAHAAPASKLLGHRCHLYDAAVTNEDTVAALKDVAAGAPGAWCEIDAWRISDGTFIVFHDGTWNRVADAKTLPAGVTRSSKITAATWAQVSKIRTKGGQPIATLQQMIDASAQYHVPLLVEVKNAMSSASAQSFVSYAKTKGASVDWYREPGASCGTSQLDGLRKAGARIGIKLSSATACTPAQLQAKGVTFITQLQTIASASYIRSMNNAGVEVYARGANRNTAKTILANGAAKLLCPDPRVALGWPGS